MGQLAGPATVPGQQILNLTDVAAGDNYVYFKLAKDSWTHFTMVFALTAMTITFEISNDPETNANGDSTWSDVTNALFGAPSFTANGVWIVDTKLAAARARVKYVRSNATNAIILNLCLAS